MKEKAFADLTTGWLWVKLNKSRVTGNVAEPTSRQCFANRQKGVGNMQEVSDSNQEVAGTTLVGRQEDAVTRYQIRFANGNLEFRDVFLEDPVPLGRQLLEAGGCDPHGDFSLFAILPSGDFEDIRLDETFDLRARGTERFVAFLTDREFKLTLDDKQIQWGKPLISGSVLYALAATPEDRAVFLEVQGGTDRLVERTDVLDLGQPGVERFITALKPPATYLIIINARPREIDYAFVTFEQIVAMAFPGTHEPNITFSMTYSHAASQPHAGELGPGGSVEVKKKGTVFNVTRTVQS
jgi:hypothetical protein